MAVSDDRALEVANIINKQATFQGRAVIGSTGRKARYTTEAMGGLVLIGNLHRGDLKGELAEVHILLNGSDLYDLQVRDRKGHTYTFASDFDAMQLPTVLNSLDEKGIPSVPDQA